MVVVGPTKINNCILFGFVGQPPYDYTYKILRNYNNKTIKMQGNGDTESHKF